MPMNRQRLLPANDFTDPEIGSLPPEVRLTASGLRMYADDEGREQVRPRLMVGELYEHDESMTSERMQEHLLMLDEAKWLRLYVAEKITLFQIRMWPPVQHPKPSRFPPPDGFTKPSRGSHETFMAVERGRVWAGESASERERAGGASTEGEPSRTSHEDGPLPPSPFCSRHQPFGTEKKCGPCGTARMAHEIWQEAARRVPLPELGGERTDDRADPEEYVTDDGRIECT
ncbi:hypothetical protein K8P10_001957 [Leucobacter sp. Psy1]|nr:hypothetical protein K8P10_001957 [Leucobacter sp. Psy1]